MALFLRTIAPIAAYIGYHRLWLWHVHLTDFNKIVESYYPYPTRMSNFHYINLAHANGFVLCSGNQLPSVMQFFLLTFFPHFASISLNSTSSIVTMAFSIWHLFKSKYYNIELIDFTRNGSSYQMLTFLLHQPVCEFANHIHNFSLFIGGNSINTIP